MLSLNIPHSKSATDRAAGQMSTYWARRRADYTGKEWSIIAFVWVWGVKELRDEEGAENTDDSVEIALARGAADPAVNVRQHTLHST